MEIMVTHWKQYLAVLLASLSLALGQLCRREIIACTKDMPDIDVILLGTERLTKEQLTTHCETLEDIERCFTQKLINCDDASWARVARVRATASNICYPGGFEEYVKHSECLSNISAEDVCRDEYRDKLVAAMKSIKWNGWLEIDFGSPDLSDVLCNSTAKYLNCIENAANATCGQAAAQFQYKLIKEGFAEMLQDVDCYLGYENTNFITQSNSNRSSSSLSLGAVVAIGLAIAVGIATIAVGSRYLCLKYAGELDSDEDELLTADDSRSEISAETSRPSAPRPSTSRASTASAIV